MPEESEARQPTAPSAPTSGEKVIQPTESIIKELRDARPAQPAPPPPSPPVAPIPAAATPQPAPAPSAAATQPFPWKKLLTSLIIILILAGLVAGGLWARSATSKLKTFTLSNTGYTYTFKYYKQAYPMTLKDGTKVYKYQNSSDVGVQTTDSPIVNDCSKVGTSFSEAFTVRVYGQDDPVCQAGSGHIRAYALIFTILGKNHLMTVTYNDGQSLYSDTSTLKAIFSSVKVSP